MLGVNSPSSRWYRVIVIIKLFDAGIPTGDNMDICSRGMAGWSWHMKSRAQNPGPLQYKLPWKAGVWRLVGEWLPGACGGPADCLCSIGGIWVPCPLMADGVLSWLAGTMAVGRGCNCVGAHSCEVLGQTSGLFAGTSNHMTFCWEASLGASTLVVFGSVRGTSGHEREQTVIHVRSVVEGVTGHEQGQTVSCTLRKGGQRQTSGSHFGLKLL